MGGPRRNATAPDVDDDDEDEVLDSEPSLMRDERFRKFREVLRDQTDTATTTTDAATT